MRFKILGLIAAVALLAACADEMEEKTATSGAGATTSTTTSTPTQKSAATKTMPGPKPGSQADLVVNVGDRVFFDFDKFNVAPDARATLQKQAVWLKKHPKLTVTVEGHCDERGTREYNLALGDRRANAVKDYLMALGIHYNRIKTISYGKEKPVALGHNDDAWSQNRRGVTTVTGGSPSG